MSLLDILILIVIAGYALERWLSFLNSRRWNEKVPEQLCGICDPEAYKKAQQYDRQNKRLALVSETLGTALLLVLLLTGAFGKLDTWALEHTTSPVQATFIFFGLIAIVSEILGLPFSIYRTFVIEARFGFNKTTPGLFISDKIKSYILAILILGSLLYIFIQLYNRFHDHFWIYTWVVASVVMVLVSMFYTSWLLPIFNKLTPLPDGQLRDAIVSYCRKTGFELSNILVMDGSKRSAKANAFFSGMGRKKKIVLFDTLIEKHPVDELVAVLAHETGHYRLRHIRKGLILSLVQTGILLYLFSVFMDSDSIGKAMGGSVHTLELGIMAFGILYSPVSIVVGLLINFLSRKHEFEADAYAARTCSGNSLCSALKKLSVNNLSNMNPHPAYVFFYYSHPPLLERIRALDKIGQTA